jgi:hypothetical protein
VLRRQSERRHEDHENGESFQDAHLSLGVRYG